MKAGSDRMSESRSEAHEAAAASRNESADCQESSREEPRSGVPPGGSSVLTLPHHLLSCRRPSAQRRWPWRPACPPSPGSRGRGRRAWSCTSHSLAGERRKMLHLFIYLFIWYLIDSNRLKCRTLCISSPLASAAQPGEANNTVLYCRSTTPQLPPCAHLHCVTFRICATHFEECRLFFCFTFL